MWVKTPRALYIDFIYPVCQFCIKFIVPRPIQTKTEWYTIFHQLQLSIWIIILISFLTVAVICFLCIKTFEKINPEMTLTENIQTDDVFLDLFSILVTPNGIRSSSIPGYTILLTCWSIYCLIITSSYAGKLVSFLTIKSYTPRIDTAEDFVRANLSWGGTDDVSPKFILDLDNPLQFKMYTNFILESYERVDLIHKNIATGKYAMLLSEYSHGKATIIKSVHDIPIMNFRIMKTCFYKPYVSLMFRYNSPYRLIFEKYHYRLYDSGILEKIRQDEISKMYPEKWASIYHEFDDKMTSKPEILSLAHVLGAFILLSIGYCVAVMVLIWEIWTANYRVSHEPGKEL